MSDISHWWGGDLEVSATGDLAVAEGLTLVEQRLYRRLCTNPGEYIWNTAYGAGLPAKIGTLLDATAVISAVRAQVYQEPEILRVPAPVIAVAQIAPGSFSVTISFYVAGNPAPGGLAFDLTP